MGWGAYFSFLAFAVVLVLIPGADFTVIVRNTLVGGARPGQWSAVGVACSNAVQGMAAVVGLGAVIVRVQPLFVAIKWAGIAYLGYLAVQAFRSAWAGRYDAISEQGGVVVGAGWRQGRWMR
jgi:threonine/homoserine/homoserine lactone efflux protein